MEAAGALVAAPGGESGNGSPDDHLKGLFPRQGPDFSSSARGGESLERARAGQTEAGRNRTATAGKRPWVRENNMFERYTEKARRVIFFARYEASQFGSPYIE